MACIMGGMIRDGYLTHTTQCGECEGTKKRNKISAWSNERYLSLQFAPLYIKDNPLHGHPVGRSKLRAPTTDNFADHQLSLDCLNA